MFRPLATALGALAAFTILTGVLYPLTVTGFAQTVFPGKADGSLIEQDGTVIGSQWIAQEFTEPEYFHPRPSAVDHGAEASGGHNLGPTEPELLEGIDDLAADYRADNDLAHDAEVPVDAVTASASGLDPHISVANARIQAVRVAQVRTVDGGSVLALVQQYTSDRPLGVLGERGVNVLELNLALDEAHPRR